MVSQRVLVGQGALVGQRTTISQRAMVGQGTLFGQRALGQGLITESIKLTRIKTR